MIEVSYISQHGKRLTRKMGISNSLFILKSQDGQAQTRYNLANADRVSTGYIGQVGQEPDAFNVTFTFGGEDTVFTFTLEAERDEFAHYAFTAQRFRS
jgi:hypothetical protein